VTLVAEVECVGGDVHEVRVVRYDADMVVRYESTCGASGEALLALGGWCPCAALAAFGCVNMPTRRLRRASAEDVAWTAGVQRRLHDEGITRRFVMRNRRFR
jgi:hypothetical protein